MIKATARYEKSNFILKSATGDETTIAAGEIFSFNEYDFFVTRQVFFVGKLMLALHRIGFKEADKEWPLAKILQRFGGEKGELLREGPGELAIDHDEYLENGGLWTIEIKILEKRLGTILGRHVPIKVVPQIHQSGITGGFRYATDGNSYSSYRTGGGRKGSSHEVCGGTYLIIWTLGQNALQLKKILVTLDVRLEQVTQIISDQLERNHRLDTRIAA